MEKGLLSARYPQGGMHGYFPSLTRGPHCAGLAIRLDVVADAESLDEFAVFVDVAVLDVLQKTATLTDKHHESTLRVLVLLVHLQMLGQVANTLGQDGHLHLGTTRVVRVLAEFGHEFSRALLADAQLVSHLSTFLFGAYAPPSAASTFWGKQTLLAFS